MNSSQRLKPIKKLADNKQKVAAISLGKSLENCNQQVDRLEQLIAYKVEYLATMSFKTRQGISGSRLQQYHQFLTKLDSAIKQQRLAVQQGENSLAQCKTDWQTDNSRAKVIGKVINKFKANETKAADKKESAQLDEMSTQAFLRSKGY